MSVVINSPSLARFDPAAHPRRAFREDGPLRLVYAGGLTPTYEVDVAIRAVAALPPSARTWTSGSTSTAAAIRRPTLRALADELGDRRAGDVPRPHPDRGRPGRDRRGRHRHRPDPTRPVHGLSLSTKVFEYAAMGKPVVATRLPLVERTFPPGTVATYEPGDAACMAAAIVAVADDRSAREAAIERSGDIVGGGLGARGRAIRRDRRRAEPAVRSEPDRASVRRGAGSRLARR